jgi:hypothetical protein
MYVDTSGTTNGPLLIFEAAALFTEDSTFEAFVGKLLTSPKKRSLPWKDRKKQTAPNATLSHSRKLSLSPLEERERKKPRWSEKEVSLHSRFWLQALLTFCSRTSNL